MLWKPVEEPGWAPTPAGAEMPNPSNEAYTFKEPEILSTGLPALDAELAGGYRLRGLSVLVAPPSVGADLSLCALLAARRAGKSVVVVANMDNTASLDWVLAGDPDIVIVEAPSLQCLGSLNTRGMVGPFGVLKAREERGDKDCFVLAITPNPISPRWMIYWASMITLFAEDGSFTLRKHRWAAIGQDNT